MTTKGVRDPAVLMLNVTIPEVTKMSSAMLMWLPGEKAAPKTIEVEAMPGQPLRVTKANASATSFDTRVEMIAEGAKYRVVVTPASTERPAFAVVNIETQIADGTKTLHACAQVRVPGAAGIPTFPALAQQAPAAAVEVEPAVPRPRQAMDLRLSSTRAYASSPPFFRWGKNHEAPPFNRSHDPR